ncbi:two-component system response regulator [Pseudodesulfovibrio tunisiensis]|uniref:two-component system response regulator n=1 Tax=Pseudodesulfovibrio tunisiensis TaxID=463192 RepID=UPI001FB3BD81|nr:EAL domain-containing response regulator [Pseudodesulfovibrio tunisiensis]
MLKKIDVLAVDDERINLRLIEGILKGHDVNPVVAGSGKEALDLVRDHDFAVALLDVMMPGMDGFELAERLRDNEATRNLPIIFITAISKEQKHVFRGYELGAVDYLFKPVEPEILLSKVSIFAELHRKTRNLEEAKRNLEEIVTQLEDSQQALRKSEKRYRIIADYNYDWENWLAPDGSPIYVSPASERICGYPPERFENDPELFERLLHPDDRSAWHSFMRNSNSSDTDFVDLRIYHRDTRLRWVSLVKREVLDEAGVSLGVRTSLRDITNRKLLEQQVRHHALHDPLTGLANRILFLDHLSMALKRTGSASGYVGVLFIDLDRFKHVNDHYGHVVGDKILVAMAVRLKQNLRSTDTVGRIGGDEFVVLIEEVRTKTELNALVRDVHDSLSEPLVVDGEEFRITASMGLVADKGSGEADALVRNAELAMLKAKDQGKNRVVTYAPRMREGEVNVLVMESEILKALQQNQFELYYQPIVTLATGALSGFEALIRWNHPQRGIVSPGEFIPVAEESGLIVDMGRWVVRQACVTLRKWRNQFPQARDLTLAVNISAKQFAEPGLVRDVSDVITHSGVPAAFFKLEITESVIMQEASESVARLNAFKELGVALSIDDFGTGYSSLSYLQKFPLDQLKVDLSFVQRLESSQADIEIVRAMVNMAHSLRLRVVAEGIENEQQRGLLYSLQCDYGQGYLFSRPLPEKDAEELIGKS